MSKRLTITGEASAPVYNFDRRAILAAIDALGIEGGVHIQVVKAGDFAGCYRGFRAFAHKARYSFREVAMMGRDDGGADHRHIILIRAQLITRKAGEVLWHELTHAAQCSRDYGNDSSLFFKDYGQDLRAMRAKSVGRNASAAVVERYRSQKHEAEANGNERYNAEFPLAVRAAAPTADTAFKRPTLYRKTRVLALTQFPHADDDKRVRMPNGYVYTMGEIRAMERRANR